MKIKTKFVKRFVFWFGYASFTPKHQRHQKLRNNFLILVVPIRLPLEGWYNYEAKNSVVGFLEYDRARKI